MRVMGCIDQLQGLFDGRTAPEKSEIREAIATLNDEYEERGIVVTEVASGFRMQVKAAMAPSKATAATQPNHCQPWGSNWLKAQAVWGKRTPKRAR